MEGINKFINWYFESAMNDISYFSTMGDWKYTVIWPIIVAIFFIFKWSLFSAPLTIPIYSIFNGVFKRIRTFATDLKDVKKKE